jgi:hypothetical protein
MAAIVEGGNPAGRSGMVLVEAAPEGLLAGQEVDLVVRPTLRAGRGPVRLTWPTEG